MRTIELTDDESQLLTFALGMASGVATRDGNRKLRDDVVRLANAVHKNDPNWTPYAVDEGTRTERGAR